MKYIHRISRGERAMDLSLVQIMSGIVVGIVVLAIYTLNIKKELSE